MSIGVGIFLGCLVLASVYLYANTRERWNWRRIAKRTFIAFGALVAICVVWLLAWLGYEKWESRPRLVTRLEGVSLGEKLADVEFRHGVFTKRESEANEFK